MPYPLSAVKQEGRASITWDVMPCEARLKILEAANKARRVRVKSPFKAPTAYKIIHSRWVDLSLSTQNELYKLNWLHILSVENKIVIDGVL